MNYSKDELVVLKAVEKGEIPRFLYKYRSLHTSHTKKIITDLSFWFAKPDSFNDPFDCNLSEVNSHRLKDITRFMRSRLPKSAFIKKKFKSFARKNPKKLVIEARKSIFGEKGILSLSKVHDNILMWSHYASSHTGIVIALDTKKDPSFFYKSIEVKYRESYKPINTFIDYESNPEDYIYKMYATKSKDWEYEKEVRIYKDQSGSNRIKPMAICKIYFGCKVDEKKKNEFIELCKEKKMNHLKFYKGEKLHGKFGLTFREIKT